MTSYYFELPMRTPTLNEWQRMHWARRGRIGRAFASEMWIALAGKLPRQPLKRCTIRVERVSTKEPDPDSLAAGLKPLLDALQPASKRHPYGLGLIADDTRECIGAPEITHVAGKASKTRVWIEAA